MAAVAQHRAVVGRPAGGTLATRDFDEQALTRTRTRRRSRRSRLRRSGRAAAHLTVPALSIVKAGDFRKVADPVEVTFLIRAIDQAEEAARKAILEPLVAYNDSKTGETTPSDRVRDRRRTRNVVGGLSGAGVRLALGRAVVRAGALREQGVGTELMRRAEAGRPLVDATAPGLIRSNSSPRVLRAWLQLLEN
jgi:hypothetical protein